MPEKFEKDIGQENLDDLIRRYRRGFFLMYNESGEGTAVYLAEVTSKGGEPIAHIMMDELTNKDISFKDIKLVEVYPEKGLYNYISQPGCRSGFHYDPVFLFSRSPRRQWAHGIRKETCSLSIPFGNDVLANAAPNMQNWMNIQFNFGIINSIFKPAYPSSWKAALEFLEHRPQVALSKDFMLMHDFTGPGLLLINYYQIIGSADRDGIKVHEPMLAQEVLDLVKRNKYAVKFEVA